MKKQIVNVGSVPKLSTGAESASITTPTLSEGTSSTVSTAEGGAPVVAPKGFRLQLSQMLAGWEQVIPTGSAVPSRGGTLDQASILAQLEGFMEAYSSLDSAALAVKTARGQEQSNLSPAKALIDLLKEALTAFFGANSPQLARFGLKPKAARKALTVKKLAVSVARSANTRKIRGTMGSVQKADLKSGPMTVSVAPAETPVAPTEDAAPAVSPPVVGSK